MSIIVRTLANPDGSFLSILAADRNAGTAYKMTTDIQGDDATISRIVLCKCLPGTGGASSTGAGSAPLATAPTTAAPTTGARPATADPTALTFGGTARIQEGMSEADLSSVGITPEPASAFGCNAYSLPGTSSLKVIAKGGKVLGVSSGYVGGGPNSEVHTDRGIRVGDTAAQVRDAYRDARLETSYQGLGGTKLVLAADSSGDLIGFTFSAGGDTSATVPDSAELMGIAAGDKSLVSGHEVCSG